MHIGFVAIGMAEEKKTGIEYYFTNLLKSLARIDSWNQYTVYVDRAVPESLAIRQDNFSIKILRGPPVFWRQTRLTTEMIFHSPDVLFFPTPSLPLYHPCGIVTAIPDVIPLTEKDYYNFLWRVIFKRQCSYAVKHSHRIVAISESTKSEISRFFNVNADKISVIYLAYDSDIYKPENDLAKIKRVKQRYNIPGSYILCVGTLNPHKNIERLVQAFGQLKARGRIEHKLVISGKPGFHYERIIKLVGRLALEQEIIFTGYVPQSDLPALMSGADLFVFPSLYEGFGMPPLEAMACGVPVLVSNSCSLPEVVGDAAVKVDPYSVEAIADGIYEVLSNAGFQSKLRQRGLKRAELFSWEKTARKTLQLLEDVFQSPGQ
jgi:glycosyltransferase involved in cell wall biosynthesis